MLHWKLPIPILFVLKIRRLVLYLIWVLQKTRVVKVLNLLQWRCFRRFAHNRLTKPQNLINIPTPRIARETWGPRLQERIKQTYKKHPVLPVFNLLIFSDPAKIKPSYKPCICKPALPHRGDLFKESLPVFATKTKWQTLFSLFLSVHQTWWTFSVRSGVKKAIDLRTYSWNMEQVQWLHRQAMIQYTKHYAEKITQCFLSAQHKLN